MNPEERYLFDLNGFIVIRQVLSPERVLQLNRVVDSRQLAWHPASGHVGMDEAWAATGNRRESAGPVSLFDGPFLHWGESFRRLVGMPAVLPYLDELVGPAFRYDHGYVVYVRAGCESRHSLHGGGVPHDPSQFFGFRDGRMLNGLVGVIYALTDAPDGGFCCIPGSHKSNYELPDSLASTSTCLAVPRLYAGDALLFTEGLTHGTVPWKQPHDRRALILKYAPQFMQWERRSPFVDVAQYEWADHELLLLRGPTGTDRAAVLETCIRAMAKTRIKRIGDGRTAILACEDLTHLWQNPKVLDTQVDIADVELTGRTERGVQIKAFRMRGSLLEEIGLRLGDVLISVDECIVDTRSFSYAVGLVAQPGSHLLTVRRGDLQCVLTVDVS